MAWLAAGRGPAGDRRLPRQERIHKPDMIKVKARSNESVQQMLKRFKKMCEKEGLTKDIKRNSYYEKPSERRRRRLRKTMKRVASSR
jgi:small subunit ribosomal protein S21